MIELVIVLNYQNLKKVNKLLMFYLILLVVHKLLQLIQQFLVELQLIPVVRH